MITADVGAEAARVEAPGGRRVAASETLGGGDLTGRSGPFQPLLVASVEGKLDGPLGVPEVGGPADPLLGRQEVAGLADEPLPGEALLLGGDAARQVGVGCGSQVRVRVIVAPTGSIRIAEAVLPGHGAPSVGGCPVSSIPTVR